MMKQKTFEKSFDKIWKLKIKVIIFAPTFAKGKRKKSSLKALHINK